MKTKIRIYSSDDPFDESFVELDVPKGTKILSHEPYVKELYSIYTENYIEPVDGSMVEATILKIDNEAIEFDISSKQSAYSVRKTEDEKYVKDLVSGDRVLIKVKFDPHAKDYNVFASVTEAALHAKINDIVNSIGKPTAYEATVISLVPGGYIVEIDSIKVFMPGSLASMNKMWNFESLLGQEIIVMPINFSQEKRTIVVSRRAYLQTLLHDIVKEAHQDLSKTYTGNVTGTTKFGVFVEFEMCVTGLMVSQDLDEEWKVKFDAGEIKPGDEVNFTIKEIINDKKIMLTQLPKASWEGFDQRHPPSSTVVGKIIKIVSYGAFIEIERGIVGMLHSSEYKKDTLEVEDDIEVMINKIDIDNKRIVLKSV